MSDIVKLKDVASIEISNVDKKTKVNEVKIKLCNFVDVYKNWSITKYLSKNFMNASASEAQIERLKLKKGQVAITKDSETRDDIGISTYIEDNLENIVLGYHCVLITPKKDVLDGCYLNAYLHSVMAKKYFENNASGSGQRYTLTNDIVENIPIVLPDITKQEKTGKIFTLINKKLENNIVVCSELESLAKLIYDYWFVQFDFPDENGRPYKSSGGKMVWNEELKREIPEGWKAKRLGEIFSITMGTSPKGADINNVGKGLIFYQGNADFGFRYPKIRTYSTKSIKTAEPEDVLLSVRAPVGAINKAFKKCCIGRGVAAINSQYYSFAYYKCLSLKKRFDAYNSDGTTFGCIGKDDLNNLITVCPQKELIRKFEAKINPIDNMIRISTKENSELTSLRDFLLPMLMNGQVTIKDQD